MRIILSLRPRLAEAARVMNTIFRHFLGIRPHIDEGDDYAIGAEW